MAVHYEIEVDVKDAEKKINQISSKFEDAFNAGRAFDGNNLALKKLISETSTYLRQLKQQYEDTVSALGDKAGDSPYLKKLKDDIKAVDSELQGLRENLKERRMSSENMFLGISQGAQGVMGAFAAAQGAAALFGAEEEKLQKIQTKLQASMSILMGLQRVGNVLQSTSQFRVQVLNKLQEQWYKWNLKVAASEGVKKAAMAGIVGAIGLAIAGITALIVKFSKYNEEVQKAKELQKTFKTEFANSATSQITTLTKLQAEWKGIGDNADAQNKFIARNKSEFEQLGVSVKNVADAEKALVENADDVRSAILAKATAAARLAQINALVAESMKLQAEIESGDARKTGWWSHILAASAANTGGAEMYDAVLESRADINEQKVRDKLDEVQQKIDAEVEKYTKELEAIVKTGGNRLTDAEYEKTIAARMEAARKGYESILRLNQDMENKLSDARISSIQNESQREMKSLEQQHQKRIQEIEREKQDYIERLKDQAKLEFLATNPNADESDFNNTWKPTPEQQRKIDEYYGELAELENNAFELAQSQLIRKQQQSRIDYMKKYGGSDQVKKAITEEYDALINEADKSGDIWKRLQLQHEKEEALWQADNASRIEYLNQYGSLREKELAITERYDHLIENEKDEYRKKALENERDGALEDLRRQYSGLEALLSMSADKMSRNMLADAIKEVNKQIEEAKKNGKSVQDLMSLYEKMIELESKMGGGQWGFGSIFSGFSALRQAYSDYETGDEEKRAKAILTISAANDRISSGASQVNSAFSSLGSALENFDGLLGEIGSAMKQLGESTADFVNTYQSLQTGDKGAAISSIINGTIQMIANWADQIAENKKAQEEWNKSIRQTAHEFAMLQIESLEYKQANIFGVENPYKKAADSARMYGEAISQIHAMEEQWKEGEIQTGVTKAVNWKNVLAQTGAGAAIGAGVGTIVGGWAAGIGTAIGTVIGGAAGFISGLFNKKVVPIMENLTSVYGELYDENFNLNQRLIADYDKLDDATKQIVDNWDEIVDKMREAEDAMRENFSELAGDLGDKLATSLSNAFRSGKLDSAIGDFKKDVNKTIESILEQAVFASVFQDLFDNLEKEMMASFGAGGDQNIVDDIMRFDSQWQDRLGAYGDAMKQIQDYYDGQGYDLFKPEAETRTAASKAISGVSQESFDDALGRFTAIQSHTYEINETTKALHEQQANLLAITNSILGEVIGIHADTVRIQESIDSMQGDMTIIRSNTSTMTDKGVRMLN